MDGPGSDHKHEVLRRRACRRFRKSFLGSACDEAALLAESAPLGRRGVAKIPRLELARRAIGTEVENPLAREIAIPGAVLPNFLAGCEHHSVELYFDRAFQLALWRLAE